MHIKEHIRWLERNNLIETAKGNANRLKKVFKDCLNVGDESVLVIGDKGHKDRRIAPLMTASYYIAAHDLGINASLYIQEPKRRGEKAEDGLIDAIGRLEDGSVLVLNLSARLGSLGVLGKSYRKLVKEKNFRFSSMPNVGALSTDNYPFLLNPIDIDYGDLRKKENDVKRILDSGDELHVSTQEGTDLYMNIKGMKAVANDGDYKKPGTGGNIPAGEVYVPPRGKNGAEGKIVVDISSAHREASILIKEPITLTVEEGKIISIEGGEEARILENSLKWAENRAKYPWGIRRIGEFGIGMNPHANIIGATIVDEKVLGTAHFGIGSNYWFGGSIFAIIHLDQIFKDPEISVDGEKLNI